MKLLKLEDLKDHDVYEFCYAKDYPNHWNDSSLYLSVEDFLKLSPYLDKTFPNYRYYGPQKVMLYEWQEVKKQFLSSENDDSLLTKFFMTIDKWIADDIQSSDHFWILGI